MLGVQFLLRKTKNKKQKKTKTKQKKHQEKVDQKVRKHLDAQI